MRSMIFVAAISILLALYGGLHYYAYRKKVLLIPRHRGLLISALVAMCLSLFVAIGMTHEHSAHALTVPIAWAAFLWMGYVFVFFVLSAPIDLLGIMSAMFGGHSLRSKLAVPGRTVAVGLLALGVVAYGSIASRQINVERLEITSNKLQESIRIVQISDLHLGILSSKAYLRDVVENINALQPDFVVVTGDLVDMQLDHLNALGEQMAKLSARYGKFAVYGNHEAFAGLDASQAFIRRAGFTLLSNSGIEAGGGVTFVGVDDPAVENRITVSSVNEAALLAQFGTARYTVLLKHQPVVDSASRGRFDLQLSGHTHGGQIFPFGLLTQLVYRAPLGLSEVGKNSWLYVSRGTGTWGPPIRVLAPPEITLIQLLPAKR